MAFIKAVGSGELQTHTTKSVQSKNLNWINRIIYKIYIVYFNKVNVIALFLTFYQVYRGHK